MTVGSAVGGGGGERGGRRLPRAFHEAPLVVFTALGVAGAGVGAGRILLGATGEAAWATPQGEALVVLLLLLLGTAASSFHLGRPLRAGLALRGMGRSALTAEVLALGAAVVAAGLAAFLPVASTTGYLGGILLPWLSLGVLLTLGTVYRLPGQVGWEGSAFLRPLALGTLFGMVAQGAAGNWDAGGVALGVFLLVCLADAFLLLLHSRRLEGERGRAQPSHPALFARRRPLLALRLVLVNGVALLGLLLALVEGALPPGHGLAWTLQIILVSVAAGVLLDRFLFYALAARRTTEGEVGRVEDALRQRPVTPQRSAI
jgi:DMSO reductase anchor subunit